MRVLKDDAAGTSGEHRGRGMVRRALEAGDGEAAGGLGGGGQGSADGAAEHVRRPGVVAEKVRLGRTGEGVVGLQPGLGVELGVSRARDHVELFGGGFEFGDQDLEGIAGVVEWEHGAGVGFADEAEEFFPAAWDDEAEEFGVIA